MKKFIFTIAALVFGLSQMTAQKMIFPEVIEVPQGGSAPLTITYETGGKVITTYMFNFVLPNGLTLAQGDAGMDWKQDANNKGFTPMPNGTTGLACLSSNVGSIYLKGTDGTLGSVDLEAAKSLPVGEELEVKATQLAFSEYVGGNYETINFDDVVIKVKIVENRIPLDENSTTAPEAAENVNVLVKRSVKAGNWGTICLPFAMTEDQVKAAFGDGAQLADFTGAEIVRDAEDLVSEIKVKFVTATSIEANHPYLLKLDKEFGDIKYEDGFKVDGVTINAKTTPQVGFDYNDDSESYLTFFRGVYVPTVLSNTRFMFLSGNKFYYTNTNTKIKGFRGYFVFDEYLTKLDEANSKINIVFDGDATAIGNINKQNATEDIYSVSGMNVGKDASRLQRGVYIVNGKKVVKK